MTRRASAAAAFAAAAALAGLGRASEDRAARAQDKGLRVVSYTPAPLDLGGNRYIMVRGMLENQGAVGLADIAVSLVLWGDDPDAPLGRGSGVAFLDQVAPGEVSPFTVAIRHCCPQDARRFDFAFQARERRERPYRALELRGVTSRPAAFGPARFGELVNTGDRPIFAASLDVYGAYWSGGDLIDLRTANLPVLWNETGPTGQPLSPGMAYPLVLAEPAAGFDRVDYYVNGEPFPAGAHAVPLGLSAAAPVRDGGDLVWDTRLHHCGASPVELASAILVWRDDGGLVRGFTRWDVELAPPLAPGEARRFRLRLTDAPPAMGVEGHLEWLPLAHGDQPVQPAAFTCPPLEGRSLLPALERP